jgi:hypothetical protein
MTFLLTKKTEEVPHFFPIATFLHVGLKVGLQKLHAGFSREALQICGIPLEIPLLLEGPMNAVITWFDTQQEGLAHVLLIFLGYV